MCGISGFITFSKNSDEILKKISIKMSNTLVRRGPDSSGVWTDSRYGLSMCHRRLSIIDLSRKAAQPMHSHNERYVLIYNGELYNFKKIKKILESTKKKFFTSSDTEVLLELISEKGVLEAVKQLNGIFSFAVWDKKLKKLFIVRDRVGIKPVYIYWDEKTLAFASELKALKKLPWLNLKIDLKSVSNYVRLNYIPAPYSIYENVIKLLPGSVFEIDLKKKKKITKYFHLDINKKKNIQYPDKTYELLDNSVKSQMVSDVPLGVFLSGGIDSSLITALAQQSSYKPINSFTIGFEDNEFNEAQYAKKISNILGTNHNEFYFNYNSITDLVNILPDVYDEPFADSSQLPTLLLSKITKKKVTVALSGDGGDELFGGYYRYFLAEKYKKLIFNQPQYLKNISKKIINFIPKNVWNSIGNFLPHYFGGNQFGDKLLKLSSLLNKNQETAFQRRIISNYNDLSELLIYQKENKSIYYDDKYEDIIKDTVTRMQFLDFSSYLPDDILTKVDRASMNYSLEVRVPFLDNDLIDHAWGLDKKYKVANGQGKLILKQILRKFLPQELIERPKMGFGIPLDKILIDSFSKEIEYFIYSTATQKQQIFNVDFYKKLWEEHKSKKRNWQFLLWNFFVFQIWYDHWESG